MSDSEDPKTEVTGAQETEKSTPVTNKMTPEEEAEWVENRAQELLAKRMAKDPVKTKPHHIGIARVHARRELDRKRNIDSEKKRLRRRTKTYEKEIEELNHKIAKLKQTNMLVDKPLSPNQARAALFALCREKNYDPIESLIDELVNPNSKLKATDRINIHKFIANKFVPDVQSVKVDATMSGGLTVKVLQFGGPEDEALPAEMVTEEVEGE